MATAALAWIVAVALLGGMTGLRSMTPIAVLCWFAYRGHLPLGSTWGQWAGNPVSVIVFAVLAVGELIGDKMPWVPARTSPFPLFARVCFGGLVGALAATGLHVALLAPVILGAVSAVAGAFLGFHVRRNLVKDRGFPDLPVALVEDLLAVGLSFVAMRLITE